MSGDFKPLRTGVAGLKHGASHAGVIVNRSDMELVAVCDLDTERCCRILEANKISASCYISYETMLAEAGLDAVVIATPPQFHEEMAVMALERGVHVLLEKPPAPDLDATMRIKAAADKSDAVCQVGFEMRSSPLVQKIREIIDSGQLGDIVLLWANMFRGGVEDCPWRMDRGVCAGLFFDCFIHEINEMQCWAGADFERVSAFGAPVGVKGANADGVPDTVAGCIEFQNAVRACITFSQVSKTTNDTHFGIVGTDGRIDGDPWLPEGAGSLWLYTRSGLYKTQIIIDGQKASRGHLGFAEQYDFFVQGIREKKALICDMDDAVRTQRLMTALDRSMTEGRIVLRSEFD